MKKLKCESCGAKLNVNENDEYVTCEYCGAKYKAKDSIDLNVNLNVDDSIKDTLKIGGKMFAKTSIIALVAFCIVFVVALTGIIYSFSRVSSNDKSNNNNNNLEIETDPFDEIRIKSFNSKYELYSGTNSKFFIDTLLDETVTNNKTNDEHIIEVVFGEIKTSDPEEITNIKQSLEDKKYEIVLDYGKDKYVNKVTIQNID